MRVALALCLLVGGSAACAQSEEAPGVSPSPEVQPGVEVEVYGAAFDDSVPFVELSQVLRDPRPLLDTTVRTAGEVQRVCKKAGCWLELAAAGSEPLRVPMAGHAFSVPQSLVGQRAEIQGTLAAMPLPEAHRSHVAAEGATALGPLSLTASAVKPLP